MTGGSISDYIRVAHERYVKGVHCCDSVKGFYLDAPSMVDIATGWIKCADYIGI